MASRECIFAYTQAAEPDPDDHKGRRQRRQRLAVLGGPAVGKTALLTRCVSYMFDTVYRPTIGDSQSWITDVDGISYFVTLYDSEGQAVDTHMDIRLTTGVDGYLLVFSVTDASSFRFIINLSEKLMDTLCVLTDRKGVKEVPRILVGTKADLEGKRKVSYQEAAGYAAQEGIQYIETSARNGQNCVSAFHTLIRIIQQNIRDRHMSPGAKNTAENVTTVKDRKKKKSKQIKKASDGSK